jgi:hypothetical protein
MQQQSQAFGYPIFHQAETLSKPMICRCNFRIAARQLLLCCQKVFAKVW